MANQFEYLISEIVEKSLVLDNTELTKEPLTYATLQCYEKSVRTYLTSCSTDPTVN